MKSQFSVLRAKGVALKTAASAALLSASVGVYAQTTTNLPAFTEQLPDKLEGAVNEAAALVGPAILLVIVAFVGIGLVKKFSKKVS